MPIDTSKVNQKISILQGQYLFEEGNSSNSLNIVHEGSYSLEKKFDKISLNLLKMNGKNLTPGVISLFSNGRYPYSIRSISNSVVSTYQVTQATIKKSIMGKMSLGIMIARTLLRENLELIKKANAIQELYSDLEHTLDNLSLSYYILEPTMFPGIVPDEYQYSEDEVISDPVFRLTRQNLSLFWESGGKLPQKPNISFLSDKHSDFFKKDYSSDMDFDDGEFLFMRKVLSADPNIQTPLYEADITILLQICDKFSKSFLGTLDFIEEKVESLLENLNLFAGKNGLIEKYFLILEMMETGITNEKPEVILPILDFLNDRIEKIQMSFKAIFLADIPDASPKMIEFPGLFKKIQTQQEAIMESMNSDLSPSSESGSGEGESIKLGLDSEAINRELLGSSSKIMNYAELSQDQIKECNALLAKFKTMKNPLDPDSEARKIRKNLTKIFWDAYNKTVLKSITGGRNIPKYIDMFLRFGYFDETLLEGDQKAFLFNFKDNSKSDSKINVFVCDEWLDRIYHKNSVPSLDELGQTYFDKIKADNKESIFKKESDVPPELNKDDYRMSYELNAMYMPNVRLTTRNPASYVPVLNKFQINLPLEKCMVTKEGIYSAIKEILSIDYTAFNREVMFNDEELGVRKEFIQKSVIPDFIIVPSIGSKIMMWQDLSILRGAGAKESKGRIILPMIVLGDLKTLLLEAVAAFRWELCKNILGPEWNNVGIPSITSEYMDYIQFYKKNKDLSIELKEKISSEFKRFRTDRDKFVNDYLLWIKYESEGVQRLNRVVRNIFYKHIPFEKTIRDKVAKLPAFGDMHTRFINIRNRQHKEFETKYRKYVDPTGRLPDPLQENLDFYKV